ncbi:tetratricopeptide repeat protein [Candidatus Leptofilum sp.]|uniref:tetratricopeptide repeat protein n=1 Tax=Candidatus Leptofilum sp. TaxID=3241576 RepID=UPI003B5CCEA3
MQKLRKYWHVGLALIGLAWLIACSKPAPATSNVPQPTNDLAIQPTPTLASGLPTLPPPTPQPNQAEEVVGTAVSNIPTVTPIPTATPLPSPTPTPAPQIRLTLAEAQLHNGDFAAAIENLTAAKQIQESYTTSQQMYILHQLGVALQADGRFPEAITAFEDLEAQFPDSVPTDVYMRLGQLHGALGDSEAAIAAYQFYLGLNPEMAAYVEPLLAEIFAANGETASVVAAYEAAVAAPAQRLKEVANRQRLAQLYVENGRFSEAIRQYNAIRDLARTEFTKGQMNYLAGMAYLAMEDTEAAYGRFQLGLTQYPRAYETYLGLVQLVEAGVIVDEYQRGVVNFHAQSYQPAIAAFERAIAINPDDFPADAHLYIAWSYEALGSGSAALAAMAQFSALRPALGLYEEANLRARAGEAAAALARYQEYLAQFPEGAEAPLAAWRGANAAVNVGDVERAVSLYTLLGTDYPNFEESAEALFLAGWLAHGGGDVETALDRWHQLILNYPQTEYGGAGMVWLQRTLPEYVPTPTPTLNPNVTIEPTVTPSGTPAATAVPPPAPDDIASDVRRLLLTNRQVDYYWLRAEGLADEDEQRAFAGNGLFFPPTPFEQESLQAEAETWLRDWLLLDEDASVSQLNASLAGDPRLIVGQKLCDAGLFEAAKTEFENLRVSVADDALLSYQLSLYFRDVGLYRSSILAAMSVLNLSGQTVFEVPEFIGQLAYPVYYADLILPLAEQYDFDPRLQFSLVRQESLFESFARSGAAAQGLSQVIPDTGLYIANLLNWPNFVNDDLYKPYVGLNFGAFYLSQQLNSFDGHAHAALAAYNGGPGNAARWYDQAGDDLDLFVETVNFPETRLYIERIFVGFVIYNFLYSE